VRLIINRKQRDVKGMLGGHKGVEFTLDYRLELTPEEANLVHRYSLGDYALTAATVHGTMVPDTIARLVAGQSQTVSNVTTLVHNERIIKDSCDELPVLFDVCRSFGGDEVIEYPRQQAAN
jgi:hypothetical protein